MEVFREKFSGSQADRVVKAEAEAKKMVEKSKETKGMFCTIGYSFLKNIKNIKKCNL